MTNRHPRTGKAGFPYSGPPWWGCFVLCALLGGCCNMPTQHAWQMPGDDRQVTLDTSQWPIVSQNLYVGVPEEEIEAAAALLGDRESVELSAAQEAQFNRHLSRPAFPDLKPFLVRAVTLGTPAFTVVRQNPSTNEVAIYRATWNGEICIPFVHGEFGIWPVVIYLDKPPMRVYPTAVYGGDWIFYGHVERDSRLIDRVRRE